MIYRFAQCQLNTHLFELLKDGHPISVEPQVFRLLQLLLENSHQVLTKDDILSTIWKDRVVSDSALSSCVKAARHAIGDNGEEQAQIRTIRGRGFRFVGQVECDDGESSTANTTQTAPTSNALPTPTSNSSLLRKNVVSLHSATTPLRGRESVVSKLTEALHNSLLTRQQVVLISGSAGIGKSRLVEEVATLAIQKGVQVLWGSCREESGAPAYWPWRQLLVKHFRAQQWLSASDSPELATLLPELFAPQASLAIDPEQSADERRFKLFHSIGVLLSHAVNEQPLLIVFDDLHRADQASLSLLEFIANELAHSSVYIIGTYRDTDLTEGHRFFQTLGELSRLPQFQSIQLGHLPQESAQEWISSTLPDSPASLVKHIIARTDGHPLYLSETIRHLQQGGDPEKLPLSLKAIINQRFVHLPHDTVEALRAASIIGRNFDISTLSEVLNLEPHIVLEKLDHGVSAGQLTTLDVPGSYRFSHTLIRETLYDSLLNSDRLHLHYNLADYLEQQQAESGLLAFHYHQAAPLGMAAKATQYAKQAAEEALELLAYEIASRYYQQALVTATATEKLDLLLQLGLSSVKAGESLQAISTFEQTIKLAEQSNQPVHFAHAAVGMEEAIWRLGLNASEVLQILHQALEKLDAENTMVRLDVICALFRAQLMSGQMNTDERYLQQARQYAEQIGGPEVNARVLMAELNASFLNFRSPEVFATRLEKAATAAKLAKQAGNDSLYVEALSWQTQDLFMFGKIAETQALLEQQQKRGLATKQPFFNYYTALWSALFSAAKGDFKAAQKHAADALDRCQWLPGLDGEGVYGLQMFTIKRDQGALLGLSHLVQKFVQDTPEHSHWKPGLALIYADLGELEKARPLFHDLVRDGLSCLHKDAMWLTCVAYLSEICNQLDETQSAKVLYDALLPYKGLNILVGSNICTLGYANRYLGLLATTMEEWELAEQYFSESIERNQQQGFDVCAAHCRYDLAKLLSKRRAEGDRDRAQNLVDEALVFSQQTGMQALTKQALTMRQKLRSGPAANDLNEFGLSKREKQILGLIAQGKQNKEIGEKLFISANTVAAHIRNILEKTATTSRIEASNLAAEKGLLEKAPKAN